MKVFFDTDVLLDVLAERMPFYPHAMRVWTLAEIGRVEGQVGAISFGNCSYIIRKHGGRSVAGKAIRLIRDAFKPVDLTGQIVNQAIDAGFADFEDAIQYHSAVRAQADCILTRNPDHFPRAPLPVLSPAEFLAAHSFE